MDGPRACLPQELPALVTAANRVFRPSGGDMGHDYPLLFAPANLANLRVIGEAGQAGQGADVVAHAGLCLRRATAAGLGFDVGAVGAVFTRDDHRHHGLAGAVVGDALSRARAAGATLALVSGDGPLYHRLGFSPLPPVACWDCPPAPGWPGADRDAGLGAWVQISPGLDIVACAASPSGDELELLARLNEAEAVHFQRSPADWSALIGAATLFAWPARTFLVRRHGRPVAYLSVAQRARRRILELAGDRDAVLAAAPLVADELVAPWHDQETAAGARARGWSERALSLGIGGLWLESPARPVPLPWYGLNYV